jgi:hypothetical protein
MSISLRMFALSIASTGLLCTPACKNGLGREVVGQTLPPLPQGDTDCGSRPPHCDDETVGGPDAGIEAIEAAPVALQTCGVLVPAICGDDALGQATAGADAGMAASDCGETLQLGASAARDSTQLNCAALRMTGDAALDAADSVRITVADWKHSNVAITSARPITLELETASLDDVWIDLSGPVTLRIVSESRMSNVRMRMRAAAAGAPRIELADSQANQLAVTSEDDPFSSTITLARMRLARTQLRAQEIFVESVAAGDVQIEAADLNIADSTFETVVFAFGHAVMAATIATNVNIPTCGTLTLANGTFEHATIEPCTGGPLRAYGVLIGTSTVTGEVDGDHALFERVRFGAHGALSVTGWDSTFRYVNFCGETRAVRFGHLPTVNCSSCQDAAREIDLHACLAPDTMLAAIKNFCPELQKDLPACPAPEPVRKRPH